MSRPREGNRSPSSWGASSWSLPGQPLLAQKRALVVPRPPLVAPPPREPGRTLRVRLMSFTRVDYGEPHLARRARILQRHPHARAFFGYDRRTAYVTFAVAALQLGIAWGLERLHDAGSWAGAWWAIVLWALLFGAILTHWLAMGIHECSHNLAAKRPLSNRLIALVANVPMLAPAAMSFYRYHIAHHTYLGVEGKDTDLAQPFEHRAIGRSRIRKLLALLFFPALYLVRAAMFGKRPDRWETLNFLLQVAVCAAILMGLGPAAFLYLAVSSWLGHGPHPVAAHFVHEHYVYHQGQETYSYYGPLNWVTFNVGYHNEHHDFMNVPGWKLPALRRSLDPYYRDLASHRSWTKVLWEFVMRDDIGTDTRIVRSEHTFRQARRASRGRATPEGRSGSSAAI